MKELDYILVYLTLKPYYLSLTHFYGQYLLLVKKYPYLMKIIRQIDKLIINVIFFDSTTSVPIQGIALIRLVILI